MDKFARALNNCLSLIGQMSGEEWLKAHRGQKTPGFEHLSDEQALKWFEAVLSEGSSALAAADTDKDQEIDRLCENSARAWNRAHKVETRLAAMATVTANDIEVALAAKWTEPPTGDHMFDLKCTMRAALEAFVANKTAGAGQAADTWPGEPVAWRVKDFADGWMLFHTELEARNEYLDEGALIEPLYALPADPSLQRQVT